MRLGPEQTITLNGLSLTFSFTFPFNWCRLLMQTIKNKFLQEVNMEDKINLSQSSTIGEIQLISSWAHILDKNKRSIM